jgi:hypothetical protein
LHKPRLGGPNERVTWPLALLVAFSSGPSCVRRCEDRPVELREIPDQVEAMRRRLRMARSVVPNTARTPFPAGLCVPGLRSTWRAYRHRSRRRPQELSLMRRNNTCGLRCDHSPLEPEKGMRSGYARMIGDARGRLAILGLPGPHAPANRLYACMAQACGWDRKTFLLWRCASR